jgi:hypothetical protein
VKPFTGRTVYSYGGEPFTGRSIGFSINSGAPQVPCWCLVDLRKER